MAELRTRAEGIRCNSIWLRNRFSPNPQFFSITALTLMILSAFTFMFLPNIYHDKIMRARVNLICAVFYCFSSVTVNGLFQNVTTCFGERDFCRKQRSPRPIALITPGISFFRNPFLTQKGFDILEHPIAAARKNSRMKNGSAVCPHDSRYPAVERLRIYKRREMSYEPGNRRTAYRCTASISRFGKYWSKQGLTPFSGYYKLPEFLRRQRGGKPHLQTRCEDRSIRACRQSDQAFPEMSF